MKKFLSFLIASLLFTLGFAQDFTVNRYEVDIYIVEKGYFDVVEKYDLTFDTYKHGIYRTIQTQYDLLTAEGNKEKRKIKISNIEVPGHKFEAPFDFEQKLSSHVTIKIGDKNRTIIGPQRYEIKYRVYNAFLFQDSEIDFYWNIKPDGWYADFHQIDFRIHIPTTINIDSDKCFVYSGDRGNTAVSRDFETVFTDRVFSGKSISNYISGPNQSVTVLMKLPVNSIKEIKPLWPFWNQYGWSLIILALISAFYYVWRRFGKDDRVIATTSYYPPENIDPAMAGFLMNDRSDSSDLIALLPHWGSHGYLKIEEIPKKGLFGKADTKLIKIKDLPPEAPAYEHEIFDGLFMGDTGSFFGESILLSKKGKTKNILHSIFGGDDQALKPGEVLVSSLQNSFYTTMSSARGILKDKAQPYYDAKSKKVKNITLGLLIAAAVLLSVLGLFYWGPIAAAAFAVSSVVLIILNTYMIKKNTRGNTILSELKGFKRFIKIAEENKLKMLLQDDPGYFENTMGYALAFGLFDKWAKKFAALNIPPPDWYSTTTGQHLSMHHFSKSFSSAMSSTRSTMVSTPSSSGGSSGGGSSGGGFGGGGGGSW